ncbi:MAG: dipeptidase [Acidobacteria bacterium]|nr:dipeptidase [Acidobacteriota bacterium]
MKRMLAVCVLVLAWAGVPSAGFPVARQAPDVRALRVHRESLVIDTHIDTPDQLLRPGWKFEERHDAPSPQRPGAGNSIDLPRMREGGLDGAFFSVYVAGTVTGPPAVKAALTQLDALQRLVDTHPADLALCRTAAEVRAANAAGRIAVLIGIEGGHMINDDLAVLRDFARRGARYLTLTHMVTTSWADSSGDAPKHNGLTAFGKDVIRELNRLGVMADISHASDKAFWDVLEVSQAPVIASHSSCRALCGHERNMTDEMIQALAAKGGVIQINFADGYLDQALYLKQKALEPETAKARAEISQKYPGPENEAKRVEAMRAIRRKVQALGTTSWERIIDHIDHAVKLAGADHVGLGSDFDGASMPAGMEDCTKLPKITAALLAKGYAEADVAKILGGNILRVMEQVERVAGRLK